ncbi:hypothetical protein BCI9360_02898 [Bacillus sp. CECT 9360]|nr:hypothetical protein BCI9360_02898 [Bacillus sp. CECT 9360]
MAQQIDINQLTQAKANVTLTQTLLKSLLQIQLWRQ